MQFSPDLVLWSLPTPDVDVAICPDPRPLIVNGIEIPNKTKYPLWSDGLELFVVVGTKSSACEGTFSLEDSDIDGWRVDSDDLDKNEEEEDTIPDTLIDIDRVSNAAWVCINVGLI